MTDQDKENQKLQQDIDSNCDDECISYEVDEDIQGEFDR